MPSVIPARPGRSQRDHLHGNALILLMLLAPCAHVSASDTSTPPASESPELLARIARVENGLSSRIVIKGRPGQKAPLAERMAYHHVPAVSIALINNHRIEWARAYGELEAGSHRPATPDSLFQAGSVSKPVTAMGALRLVERGRLSLDSPVNTQLRQWKVPDNAFTRQQPVTLRALLNHSAGMNVHGFFGYPQGQPLPTLPQILEGVAPATSAPIRVEATPGTAWTYSGGGYTVVQALMTDVSRQPFTALMRSLVLDPLQMHDSTFATELPPAWRARAAHAHPADGEPVPGGWHAYPESAAAGLWTTASDLAKVVLAVQQAPQGAPAQLLSGPMIDALLTRGLGEYGLGFYVERLGAGSSFAHTGGTHGFRAQLYGYSNTGQGIVVLTNSDSGAALVDELLVSVAAEYGWPEFQTLEKTARAPDPAVNAEVAGDYLLLEKPARIIAEGDRLYFQSDLFGAQRMELFAQSPRTFFMTAQDMTLDFPAANAGRVEGFSLTRGTTVYPATRN